MYMRKMAVGPRARGRISLSMSVADNIRAIADAYGRMVNDVTTIVLDRPRHHDLIEEIRAAGARIKLIQDGDVLASISAAVRGTNDHLAIGIGGTRQAVLSAAALRCLGGELQAQLWPTRRAEIEDARAHGIDDLDRIFTIDDLAPQEVIVAATGVSNGELMRGVRYLADSALHALARDVHALQLGALRRGDALLRARAARGSPAHLTARARRLPPRSGDRPVRDLTLRHREAGRPHPGWGLGPGRPSTDGTGETVTAVQRLRDNFGTFCERSANAGSRSARLVASGSGAARTLFACRRRKKSSRRCGRSRIRSSGWTSSSSGSSTTP